MVVGSIVSSPNLRFGVTSVFPIVSIWLFSFPNLMAIPNLLAISFVMFSIFWISSLSWWIRTTSSIHCRHPMVVLFHIFWYPTDFSYSYLAISSIRLAYSITDSTPPCRILSLICIVLVSPYFVITFAVRLLFSSFTIFQFFPSSPFLCTVYIISFIHALSYALVTSRNAMYRF